MDVPGFGNLETEEDRERPVNLIAILPVDDLYPDSGCPERSGQKDTPQDHKKGDEERPCCFKPAIIHAMILCLEAFVYFQALCYKNNIRLNACL